MTDYPIGTRVRFQGSEGTVTASDNFLGDGEVVTIEWDIMDHFAPGSNQWAHALTMRATVLLGKAQEKLGRRGLRTAQNRRDLQIRKAGLDV